MNSLVPEQIDRPLNRSGVALVMNSVIHKWIDEPVKKKVLVNGM